MPLFGKARQGAAPGAGAPPPESAVREVVPAARLVAVIGAKGGVGATTVAANLAVAAARAGSALALDLAYVQPGLAGHFWEPGTAAVPAIEDVYGALEAGGDLAMEQAPRFLEQYLQGLPPVHRALTVAPAAIRPSQAGYVLPPPGAVAALLEAALRLERWVVADLPAALDEAAEAACRLAADQGAVVLVTTPEPDAVLAAARMRAQLLEGAGLPPERLWLLVNRRGGPKGGVDPAEISRIHVPAPLLGTVPWMPSALEAAWRRHQPPALQRPDPWQGLWATLTGTAARRKGADGR